MAKELILRAEPRTVLGKQVKALRRAGLVPGVVYGPAVQGTIQVSVNRRDLEKFYTTYGHATLFKLEWEGGDQQVFIREVQVEPVRYVPLHVDFFAPNLLRELTASVPVVLHHGETKAEGILSQVHDEVEVRGLPHVLPHQIDADVTHLRAVGDTFHASDLKLPAGITLITAEDQVIATVMAQAKAEVVVGDFVDPATPAAPAAPAADEAS
ncbi:MAG: 50S ribosomal protein L25 [Thermomicrobiales bacterium]